MQSSLGASLDMVAGDEVNIYGCVVTLGGGDRVCCDAFVTFWQLWLLGSVLLLEIFFIRGVINEKRLVEKRDGGGVVDDDAASGVGMVLDRWMEDDWFWMLTGVDL